MSAEFMLDTDSVSMALRGQGQVARTLLAHKPSQVCVSAVTLAELRYGADRVRSRRLRTLIDTFTRHVQVQPFDAAAADSFGSVATALARRGEPIGTFDTLIAAHALSRGATLVTNNTKHFRRVAGLRLANWI